MAFFPDNKGLIHGLLPALEFAPNVPVGQAQRLCSGPNGAVLTDRIQQVHERVAQWAEPVAWLGFGMVRAPAVGKVDVLHTCECASNRDATYAFHFIADIPYAIGCLCQLA